VLPHGRINPSSHSPRADSCGSFCLRDRGGGKSNQTALVATPDSSADRRSRGGAPAAASGRRDELIPPAGGHAASARVSGEEKHGGESGREESEALVCRGQAAGKEGLGGGWVGGTAQLPTRGIGITTRGGGGAVGGLFFFCKRVGGRLNAKETRIRNFVFLVEEYFRI
jgi:hypothetical protein